MAEVELALAVTWTVEPTVEFAAGDVIVTPAHAGKQKMNAAIKRMGNRTLNFAAFVNNQHLGWLKLT